MTSFMCAYYQIQNKCTVYLQKSMTVKSYMYALCTVVIISLLSHYVLFMSEGLPPRVLLQRHLFALDSKRTSMR